MTKVVAVLRSGNEVVAAARRGADPAVAACQNAASSISLPCRFLICFDQCHLTCQSLK
ncbi:hypothetical protein ACCUM_0760 [Candidatus Accumulibacter phosphatis]|uniref:Uncharacterized protein n=1 Tax=Candidatus Accumulibacter phosphatis TaxID=327160 RepID=A0A5S4EGQ4_9PROT|nr:hypothetical protein ACCUM_0760 [Candidatus Accumulibacter phosphatis]